MHAEDDSWPRKNYLLKNVTAKNTVRGIVSWVKGAVASVKAAFALPAPAQLAFA